MKKKKIIKKNKKVSKKIKKKLLPKPKKQKKLVKNITHLKTKSSMTAIAALPTLLEQITEDFKVQVLQNRLAKVKKDSMLSDFCSDQRFKKEFKDMFLERAYAFYGVSIRHLYDNNLNDILQFLRDNKMKKIKFNWK